MALEMETEVRGRITQYSEKDNDRKGLSPTECKMTGYDLSIRTGNSRMAIPHLITRKRSKHSRLV